MTTSTKTRARGQELIEYALLVPIFLLILAVITDLGRITYSYSTIINAAREGARYGIINPSDSAGIEATVRNIAFGLEPADLTVVSDQPDLDTVRVTVTFQFDALTPLVGTLLGSNSITLDSQAVMQVE
jgi:Flp pilus assembly protein TadG